MFRLSEYAPFLGPILFAIISILFLRYDSAKQRKAAKEKNGADFFSVDLRKYFIWAIFVGGFVLVHYFMATRRASNGLVKGLAALAAVIAAAFVPTSLLTNMLASSELARAEELCTTGESPRRGDDCVAAADSFPYVQTMSLLQSGCSAGAVAACLRTDKIVAWQLCAPLHDSDFAKFDCPQQEHESFDALIQADLGLPSGL